ncbi:hypothetical protein BC834DRAFT_873172 [Gloeopeniophorella convolvens]|nr:hypothetical protein BC834DRAFT_873172 [Gloeopeniophorella convolvens]
MVASAPFPQWSQAILHARLEFRSMFIAALFLFLFLCLAYLSNPSETSFRSYLTEQSFRHHLSRLDDPADADHSDSEDSGVRYHSSSRQSVSSFGSLESGSSAFHFSNRAAIALRTPRHAFHSFGFFTIAAVIPTHKPHSSSSRNGASSSVISSRNANGPSELDLCSSPKEAWFVGAFGRWWRGGLVDPTWPPRHGPHAKCDEEGWSSGILNVKALDKLEDYNGLPFPTTTHNPRTPQRPAPPKLRSRDRSASHPHRSTTPPPLPKSAVLPLHTPKHGQSLAVPQQSSPAHQRSTLPHHPPASSPCNGAATVPSANYDTAPAVAELTRQINQTRALNLELRNQLSEHTSTATVTDAALTAELNTAREAKRIDDAGRTELKARTKTLEDSKRAAEAGKRDAERRLRTARGAKAEAGARIEKLGAEIRALEAQVQEDEAAVLAAGEAAELEEQEIRAQVKRCKREVRVAEEVVTALNVRVRELEQSFEHERLALVAAREKAEALRREHQQHHKHGFILKKPPHDAWEPIPITEPALAAAAGLDLLSDPFPTPLEKDSDRDRERNSSGTASTRSSPHFRTLSLAPASCIIGYNAPAQAQLQAVNTADALALRAKGYTIFDDDIALLSNPTPGSKFLPFGDADVHAHAHVHANGKRTFPLITNGLIQSLEGGVPVPVPESPEEMMSKSFQSDNDAFLERDWRRRLSIPESASAVGSSTHAADALFDPFEVRPPVRHRITSDPVDAPRAWPMRTYSEPASVPTAPLQAHETRTRRWWHSADKVERHAIATAMADAAVEPPRKGLNPDAKVFRFSRKPLLPAAAPAFDSLNPSGGAAGLPAPAPAHTGGGFFAGLAMRAFAPSPAEREALQRALGGSTNTSLERLPSLSEVGSSMPASPAPAHTHAHAHENPLGLPLFGGAPGASAGRSWLQELGASIARPGKIRFSPWGDGEADGAEADGGEGPVGVSR